MAIGDEDPRLRVVMIELFALELQRESQQRLARSQIEVQFQFMLSRPPIFRRIKQAAQTILQALDDMNKVEEKPVLTGEELWNSIVEASKP